MSKTEINELNKFLTMRKSMRKANAALENAYMYIASLNENCNVKPVVQPSKPCGKRIDSAEIKKLDKGYFFIVVSCDGKRIEIQKRFKSVIKAREWLFKNEYIREHESLKQKL